MKSKQLIRKLKQLGVEIDKTRGKGVSESVMLRNYPVNLISDENGTVIACFPDVPEAMTVGADEANALEWAQDALVIALNSYMDDRRDIPEPSFPENGQKIVSLPPPFAVKLKIYQSMQHKIIKEAA